VKIIRKIVAFILVVAVVFSAASKSFLLLDFLLNRDYISKNLCEKRAIKDNCCRGTCHFKKQMHEEEKREGASGITEIKNEIVSVFQSTSLLNFYFEFYRELNFNFICYTLNGYQEKIFQPPTMG